MNNEIGRKITSLTLMTIMLAGGMTIAFPGFTPDAYAVNANLIVSAENTGGDVDGAQIIEIVVIDEDISASPDITVNGDAVLMTEANDGNWYAYIAHKSAVETVHGVDGISFGATTPANIPDSGSDASYSGTGQNVVKADKKSSYWSYCTRRYCVAFHTDLRIPRYYRDTVQQSGRYSNIDPYI